MTHTLSSMNLDDLRGLLSKCAGGDDDADALAGDIVDVPFEDLGYDSLALIEAAATLKRDYGVIIPDEQLTDTQTPAELLALINDRIAAADGASG
jgi:act minimal PKS acyl carrier protein